MNIFVLDLDPSIAAQFHNDKHTVKMILETTQILSTVLSSKGLKAPYKPTHINHPCVKWANASFSNFNWLYRLGIELCKEYTYRYGKIHKCEILLKEIIIPHPDMFYLLDLTPFTQAMPEQYKNEDPVKAYRNYYCGAKKHIMKYTKREIPYWLKENECLIQSELE